MNQKLTHEQAIAKFVGFYLEYYCSGSEMSAAEFEFAAELPPEPFTEAQLKQIFSQAPDDEVLQGFMTIFAKGRRVEILPYALRSFETAAKLHAKLRYAAIVAQLGEESGYQYIESVFQRFMMQDEDMKNFDFEEFVFIFDEILTNERGQEMIARFRKEANYNVVWETLEVPDVD